MSKRPSSSATSARICHLKTGSWHYYNSAAHRGRGRRPRRPLRQDSPRPLRRIHPFSESAYLCSQAHRPRLFVHARRMSARFFAFPLRMARRIATASSSAMRRCLPTRSVSFRELGAEVLVNISDDGWYGDTSAPWQHLNMVRMRAIENRRWILRDTNNGCHGRDRSLRPRAPEHSAPPGGRAARRVRLPRRHHFLHRAWRRVRVAVCHTWDGDCCRSIARKSTSRHRIQSSNQSQVIRANMSLNDLEFAYAPVRDQVRDLREYL